MANVSHGMNIAEVRQLGNTLKQKAAQINDIVGQLNSLVHGTTWTGPDASTFKGPWWEGHRGKLQAIAQDLDGFGQSALNNASEQESVSGR